ncbi:MAG: c-type cytochrome [Rubripirellula sp.]|nr:c-type cytochrome [Rubripirellula sp.]
MTILSPLLFPSRRYLSFAAMLCLIVRPIPSLGQQTDSPIDYSAELPRVRALSPDEAMQAIEVSDDFEIQLAASEPLVNSPVAIEWDEGGGLFVCEMRGYSENREDGISQVRYLTDADDDGHYEKATVFADGLLWPTAIFPYKGGLFVADAPHVYYMKDTNGDDVADERNIVLTGFGVSNVQGLVNSFRWGLDNRIHVACSSVGGSIHRVGEENLAVNVRGRDISFDPDTYEIRLTSGGAQHGMCFDDWGHKFVSSNSDHIQQVIYEDHYLAGNRFITAPSSRRSIALDGPQGPVYRISPVEPWRIVRTRLRVGGVVSGPVEGGGRPSGYFTGATGITIYRGDQWNDDYKGIGIVGDVGSNLIHRKRITQDAIEMQAERMDPETEFIRSKDIWFRPAQFANAPDGCLYVVDVCREVIEHPKSLPPEIKQHLDLNSGRDRGRIYRVVQKGKPLRSASDLSKYSDQELANLLNHPNAWHRETAARLLYEHQNPAIIAHLTRLATENSSPQGRIHSLYCLSGIGALNSNIIEEAFSDKHPQVRRHAVRLSEQIPESDRLNGHLQQLANDPNSEVRYQLAFSLATRPAEVRVTLLSELAKQDVNSRWLTLAVLSSLGDQSGAVFAKLARDPSFRSKAAGDFLFRLAQSVVRQNHEPALQTALNALPNLYDSSYLFTLPILGTFQSSKTANHSSPDLARAIKDQLLQACTQSVDTELPLSGRLAALNALAIGDWKTIGTTLLKLTAIKEAPELASEARLIASRFQNEDVTNLLISNWITQSEQQKKQTIEAIFARPERIKALFEAIDQQQIDAQEIPRQRFQSAAKSKDPIIRQRAITFLAQTSVPSGTDRIEEYRSALQGATDPERGRSVFLKHCVSCHRVENQGYQLGPNLAAMKARGADAILANILDPNLEVNPQYINYLLLKSDGSSSTGMISSENATTVTLKRAEGQSETILRDDIEQMQSSRKSIMPEGLHQSIPPEAMADLISYLMSRE